MKSLQVLLIYVLLLGSESTIASEAKELITSFKVEDNTVHIGIEKGFVEAFLDEESFFATYDEAVPVAELPFAISTIPFITNVITIVWISGNRYTIAEMDRDLYHALKKIRKRVLPRIYPHTAFKGRLKPRLLVDNTSAEFNKMDPTKKAALLFSGGVDSTSSAFELQEKGIKLLLIMMRGQGAQTLTQSDLWRQQSENCSQFAARYGHDITFLTSNYHRFLNRPKLAQLSQEINDWRVDAVEDVGMFGMTAPILYSLGIQRLHMASSRDWSYPHISIGNPLTDRFMSFASGIGLECGQFGLTRADKIAYIIKCVQEGLETPLIHVCYRGVFPSCTLLECRKCLPTALMLYTLGADPRDYGYKVTGEELMDLMRSYLEKTQPYITLWQIMRLRDKLDNNALINEEIEWLYDVDLTAHIETSYIAHKPEVSWDDLRECAPEDLEIPMVQKITL